MLKNKLAILVGAVLATQIAMLIVQVLTWQAMRDVQREVYYVGATVARGGGPSDEPSDQRRAALR